VLLSLGIWRSGSFGSRLHRPPLTLEGVTLSSESVPYELPFGFDGVVNGSQGVSFAQDIDSKSIGLTPV
jgi:hypothetical protein